MRIMKQRPPLEPALARRLGQLDALASPCRLCPRGCAAPRLGDGSPRDLGACQVPGGPAGALVGSVFSHRGEERELVGSDLGPRVPPGSGTLFMAGCNLLCVFCQNFGLSRAEGPCRPADASEVARLSLELQRQGCANVNFVTPTLYAGVLARGVALARLEGLTIPVIWNCGGYEREEVLRLLDGLVEIYMPDIKSLDPGFCGAYLDASDYPEAVRWAVAEMARQVGPLAVGGDGLARRGLLVRHLVMPGRHDDARAVIDLVAQVCPGTGINIMEQYQPHGHADQFTELNKVPDHGEVEALRRHAVEKGLRELNS